MMGTFGLLLGFTLRDGVWLFTRNAVLVFD